MCAAVLKANGDKQIRKVEKTKQNVDSTGTIVSQLTPSTFFELLRLRIKRFFCENWGKRETKTWCLSAKCRI